MLSKTLRPNGANVLSFRIQKNSFLVGSEGSVLSINHLLTVLSIKYIWGIQNKKHLFLKTFQHGMSSSVNVHYNFFIIIFLQVFIKSSYQE